MPDAAQRYGLLMEGHGQLVAFIRSVADRLRGDYKQSEYGRVILPLTVFYVAAFSRARRRRCSGETMADTTRRVTIARRSFELRPAQVERAMRGVLPEPLKAHFVVVGRRRYPPKKVLAQVTAWIAPSSRPITRAGS